MPHEIPHVTCLGCGCACDDIVVTLDHDRILRADRACPLGAAWFGDGRVPGAVRVDGREDGLDRALDVAAALLRVAPGRGLVFLADEITCETQRAALGLADGLRAVTDGMVSATAAAGILAGQRRGRATCTLGEIRNRADLILFWGTDPEARYPRYRSRYAVDPAGFHLPGGRDARTVVSVSIGAEKGPADADLHLGMAAGVEMTVLSALRARLIGHDLGRVKGIPSWLAPLAERLTGARYVVIVHDGDPVHASRAGDRVEGLITLVQALNGPTRAALCTLRAGGNRTGAEAVMTWQTGYPFAVEFSRGYPRYAPDRRGGELLAAGVLTAALVVGAAASVPAALHPELAKIPTVVVGPRASEAPFPTRVAVDTGVAGIHEAGTGYRMDDVPLSLRAPLPGPRSAAGTIAQLTARLTRPDTARRP